MNKQKVTGYLSSSIKIIFDKVVSLIALSLLLPSIVLISIFIKLDDGGSIFFTQLRTGKNGKKFKLFKFRSMKEGSEKILAKLEHFNEADGPVFKIKNDPRFTQVGKFLSRTGFDEVPQFVNVLIGDMSLVGPRPLPVYEAKKLSKKYKVREIIKPGITSLWVINGAHRLSFKKWMSLDEYYLKKATFYMDLDIAYKTLVMVLRSFL